MAMNTSEAPPFSPGRTAHRACPHCVAADDMGVTRTAGSADDDNVVRLLNRTFTQLYAAMGVEMSAERAAYLKDQPGRRAFATSFIHEVGADAVGTITLVPPCAQSDAWVIGAWEIRLLAVDPQMQGRGIAKRLLEITERHARACGATTICLHARRGVANQAHLYLASNYKRDPLGDIDGPPLQNGYRKIL